MEKVRQPHDKRTFVTYGLPWDTPGLPVIIPTTELGTHAITHYNSLWLTMGKNPKNPSLPMHPANTNTDRRFRFEQCS